MASDGERPLPTSDAAGARRRTVLCSAGTGPHAALLEISRPSLERLAARHGWALDLHVRGFPHDRPAAWNKVVAIRSLLDQYDTVVWIDADAVVMDPEPDITAVATADRFLWMTKHHYRGEDQPNTGVLVVHAGDEARRFLDAAWSTTHLVEHPWWEQAAMLHLLGFDVTDPGHSRLVEPTEWYERVGWLDNRWNSIPDDWHPAAYVRHYAGKSQSERVALMSRDVRELLGPPTPVPHAGLSVVFPLRRGSAETALVALASLAEAATDLELVLVDDGSELRSVRAALSGSVRVIRHERPQGLAASWESGLRAASGELVALMTDSVRLRPGALEALAAAVVGGASAATTTAPDDAHLTPARAAVLAARRADVVSAGVPLAAGDVDLVGEMCLRLAASGPIARVATAVAEEALAVPPPTVAVGLPEWALRMLRGRYAVDLGDVPSRQELPWVLEARGLGGTGAEIGVQEGLFSHHLLTYWGGRRLISIDSWEHESIDDYVDIANVGQLEQDARHRVTCERLAVFGDRSEVWRLRSTDAAARIPDGSLDFVYIDARHDFDAVLEDLEAWVPKVRPGGIVAGHDYLDGDLPEGRFGVKSAVDQYFAAFGAQVAVTTLDPPWSTWLIDVPPGGWPVRQPAVPAGSSVVAGA
jgi:glycosyltransferase involved in cell wall biosynthesis